MSGRIDAATLLERALLKDATRAGLAVSVSAASSQRWASATFVGARHLLRLEGTAESGSADWLAQLADADLPLRGHLVADLIVVDHARSAAGFTATIEALTVEDA